MVDRDSSQPTKSETELSPILFTNRKLIAMLSEPRSFLILALAGALFLLGQWMMLGGEFSYEALRRYGSMALVGLSGILVIYLQLEAVRRLRRNSGEGPSFLELDRSAQREGVQGADSSHLVSEIRKLASAVSSDRSDVEAIVDRVMRSQAAAAAAASRPADSFRAQMLSIVRVLEDKSKLADEKASALLDRGVAYTKFGIGFFIVSIFIWQLLAWWHGFQTQLIFGISSCAILFVFLQFLSSWFLKQYRHFVEVSTYLIEIKSVFDRYALLHHLLTEDGGQTNSPDTSLAALVNALKDEMKWPRARPGFTEDVYYAKDAVGATEGLVKVIREGVRSKKPAKSK